MIVALLIFVAGGFITVYGETAIGIILLSIAIATAAIILQIRSLENPYPKGPFLDPPKIDRESWLSFKIRNP